MTTPAPPPPGPEGSGDTDPGSSSPADTAELGSLTVEDDLSTDPTERGADPAGGTDSSGGQADDLQADEARDPSS